VSGGWGVVDVAWQAWLPLLQGHAEEMISDVGEAGVEGRQGSV
jgi:hypothetical protein